MTKKLLLALVVSASGLVANAQYDQQPEDKTVAQLDLLKTCKTEVQQETASKILNFYFDFKWWHIKNMVDALHPEYTHWHASRVYAAVVTPEAQRDALPYKDGIVTRAEFLTDLAMVAYTNDVSRYINDFKRLECVGSDTVIISSVFHGLSVFRDKDGYITHKVQLKDIPVRFMTMLKDGRIYRASFDLDDAVTVNLFKQIKEQVRNTPPLPKDETTKTTYEEILARFKLEAGEN